MKDWNTAIVYSEIITKFVNLDRYQEQSYFTQFIVEPLGC